ncbi:MAG: DUF1559 domain-containing protein [Planctomycetota bacterium]|nr:MAG: DUF1559 domain-containing protein [Planctomycetota bacterium]REK46580.1 MAG: DUF1559 domain-containing protein [Planctomycetota bacterium]
MRYLKGTRRFAIGLSILCAVFALEVPGYADDAKEAPIDLRYIPDEAVAAIVVRPRATLEQPSLAVLPHEIISLFGQQQLGCDPKDIDELQVILGPVDPNGPPEVGMVVRLARDLADEAEQERVVDAMSRLIPPARFSRSEVAGDRTIWFATAAMEPLMDAANGQGNGALLQLMRASPKSTAVQVFFSMDSARDVFEQLADEAPELPGPLAEVKNVPAHLRAARLRISLDKGLAVRLDVAATSPDAAVELEKLINTGLAMGRDALEQQVAEQQVADGQAMEMEMDNPLRVAKQQYAERVIGMAFASLAPRRKGRTLRISIGDDGGVSGMAGIGVMTAMLMPAVTNARDSARSINSMAIMKQLGMVLIARGELPPAAIRDANGNPLLSWRVAILPVLGQQELYERFRLDEPWDSEHNLPLLDEMPDIFRNPSLPLERKTTYLLVTGEQTLFGMESPSLRAVTDGVSNTIMMVEVNPSDAVEWTRPLDWEFDPERPTHGLGGIRADGFHVLLCDGSVHTISPDMDGRVLNAMMTSAGREVITEDGQLLDGE